MLSLCALSLSPLPPHPPFLPRALSLTFSLPPFLPSPSPSPSPSSPLPLPLPLLPLSFSLCMCCSLAGVVLMLAQEERGTWGLGYALSALLYTLALLLGCCCCCCVLSRRWRRRKGTERRPLLRSQRNHVEC
jgi:hypothetical protein